MEAVHSIQKKIYSFRSDYIERNDPSAGSPTETLLRLTSYLAQCARSRSSSSTAPSETVTDGVNKPQGQIRHGFLNHRYWEFRVRGNLPSPVPQHHFFIFNMLIVLRVLPKAPRGITDLPLPYFLLFMSPSKRASRLSAVKRQLAPRVRGDHAPPLCFSY